MTEQNREKIKFNNTSFLISAAKLAQLPPEKGGEVAFIGRSNAGKSSAINALVNNKSLAKTSKTPGRTQLINVFTINNTDYRIIDLPGYGFAKVPDKVKEDWSNLLDSYLRQRNSLLGLVIVMDIRHPLTTNDWNFLNWTQDCNITTHILLTKSDKLKFAQKKKALMHVNKEIKVLTNQVTVQLFSSTDKTGVEDLQTLLTHWYQSQVE